MSRKPKPEQEWSVVLTTFSGASMNRSRSKEYVLPKQINQLAKHVEFTDDMNAIKLGIEAIALESETHDLKFRRLRYVAPHCDPIAAQPDVPSAAETILSYIATADRLEAVLGDLQRNFSRRAAKHGEKAARRWYWWQTIRTAAAFGVQLGVKAVMLRELLKKLGL